MRKVALFLDSLGAASHRSGNDDLATPLHASELYLMLGDSANALRATRWFTDSTMAVLPRISTSNDDWEWGYLLAPRMMKQRGDLAAKLGFAEEARTWYERVLSLWATADPEFKPQLTKYPVFRLDAGEVFSNPHHVWPYEANFSSACYAAVLHYKFHGVWRSVTVNHLEFTASTRLALEQL